MWVRARRDDAPRGDDPVAGRARTPGGLTARMVAASALLAVFVLAAFAVLLLAISNLRDSATSPGTPAMS